MPAGVDAVDDPFRDRRTAGRMLAARLGAYAGRSDLIVLGLPRGGVPVAYEVARVLGVKLDVFVVRKLGVPHHPELAMGAIASGGARYVNDAIVQGAHVSSGALEEVLQREQAELVRRERLYRGSRPTPDVAGRTVILVDDGMATGASMRVALMALRSRHPARIVVALPVAPKDAADRLGGAADEVVCVLQPEDFYAVGQFYEDFGETSDTEVRELLAAAPEIPA